MKVFQGHKVSPPGGTNERKLFSLWSCSSEILVYSTCSVSGKDGKESV